MSKKLIVACTVCFIAALLLMVFAFVGCGHLPPNPNPSPTPSPTAQPSPSPTPQPSPTPGTGMSVLTVKGTQFMSGGKPIKLMGAISCCTDSKTTGGWPWASEDFMRRVKANGGNHITIRLGPNAGQEDVATLYAGDPKQYPFDGYVVKHLPGWEPYYPLEFDQAFWLRLKKTIATAEKLGLFAEISVVDGWCLRHRWPPWESNQSGIMASSPKTHHKLWIQKVAKETGSFPNVIYLDGNENFLPTGVCQLAWSGAMADLIHQVEQENGYPRHLFGTNSRNPQIEKDKRIDFIADHGDTAISPRYNKPLYINEAGPKLNAKRYAEQAAKARSMGSEFFLWRGDMDAAEFDKALAEMKKITSGQ